MNKVILGIDPGTAITGFGVIRESEQKKIEYLDCGYIATSSHDDTAKRLWIISKSINQLIKKYHPQLVAVEHLFFAKNRATAMAVAQARGAVLAILAKHELPLVEYTPLQIKQTLTGYGRADKQQMQKMVKSVLRLDQVPKPDDSADALAVAICAVYNPKPMLK